MSTTWIAMVLHVSLPAMN